MLRRTYAVAALAAVPALLALSTPRETIRFAPREGLVLAKTFETNAEMVLDEMEMLMNGEPAPIPTEMDLTVSSVRSIEVVDTYVSVADGRVGKLARKFTALGDTSEMAMSMMVIGDQEMSVEGESELTGQGVHFTWNADDEGYDVSFDDESDGDEELLENLREDMDLRSLLPPGDVSVGDTWSIDPEAMVDVLSPGGDLAIVPDEDAMEDMGGMGGGNTGMNLGDMLGDISGEVTGTLTAIRDGNVAVITIELEIESTNDLTESIREMMADSETPAGVEAMEIESVDVELSMEGEGVLLWSIDGGHFLEFTLSSSLDSTMDQAMSIEVPGQSMSMEQAMIFTSTAELTYTAEAL